MESAGEGISLMSFSDLLLAFTWRSNEWDYFESDLQ